MVHDARILPFTVCTVITVVPIATPRTRPEVVTDAIAELLEDHDTDLFDAVDGKIVEVNWYNAFLDKVIDD